MHYGPKSSYNKHQLCVYHIIFIFSLYGGPFRNILHNLIFRTVRRLLFENDVSFLVPVQILDEMTQPNFEIRIDMVLKMDTNKFSRITILLITIDNFFSKKIFTVRILNVSSTVIAHLYPLLQQQLINQNVSRHQHSTIMIGMFYCSKFHSTIRWGK